MSKEKFGMWGKTGYCSPGGDPVWRCPFCKSEESVHVYGIETQKYRMEECPVCHARLYYPGETYTKP